MRPRTQHKTAFQMRRWISRCACSLWIIGGALALEQSSAIAQGETVPDFTKSNWIIGQSTGELGRIATLRIPKGFVFGGLMGVREFLEANENPVSNRELGILLPDAGDWYAIFEFNPIGYVKEDEMDRLHPAILLESIRVDNRKANKERVEKGWPTMQILGWAEEPKYDPVTKNLLWAVRAESEGQSILNHNTRLLGRRGVMQAVVVATPTQMDSVVQRFKRILVGFSFTNGNRYWDFQEGDRVANYGLATLISGGSSDESSGPESTRAPWLLVLVAGVVILSVTIWSLARGFLRPSHKQNSPL